MFNIIKSSEVITADSFNIIIFKLINLMNLMMNKDTDNMKQKIQKI